jgi:hypothetical protein
MNMDMNLAQARRLLWFLLSLGQGRRGRGVRTLLQRRLIGAQ